jgi:glucokinase
MSDEIVIGVDLGGTKIAFAAVDRDGRVLADQVLATRSAEGADAVIERITQGIERVAAAAGKPVVGVGIGSPGAIDVANGVILNAVNLNWIDVPLAANVRAGLSFNVPVSVQNDVNVGALGEYLFGAARGVDDFIYLAVGTGLGGGAVTGGRLVSGAFGMAMEVGHIAIKPGGRLCGCGTHGCAEMYISGKGILEGTLEHLAEFPDSPLLNMSLTTAAIVEADKDGDPLAHLVVDEACEALGTVMAWTAALFNPSLILIGGGMGKVLGERLLEGARAALLTRVYPPMLSLLKFGWSQIDSMTVGAAALAWLNRQ